MISDGMEARAGTLTSDYQRFMPWKTISGEKSFTNYVGDGSSPKRYV